MEQNRKLNSTLGKQALGEASRISKLRLDKLLTKISNKLRQMMKIWK